MAWRCESLATVPVKYTIGPLTVAVTWSSGLRGSVSERKLWAIFSAAGSSWGVSG